MIKKDNLKSSKLPSSAATIGTSAFYGCIELRSDEKERCSDLEEPLKQFDLPLENEHTKKWGQRFRELIRTERKCFANSCNHCTDLEDSFGRYTGTYCHIKQKHLVSLETDELEQCKTCNLYDFRRKEQRNDSTIYN